MRIVQRLRLECFVEGAGPITKQVDGRPVNCLFTVNVYRTHKHGVDVFWWATGAGNSRRKNLHGPFASLEGAAQDAELRLTSATALDPITTPEESR